MIDADNIIIERRNAPICSVSNITLGNVPKDDGNFFLTSEEKNYLLKENPISEKWIRRFYGSREYINNIDKWCLWTHNANPSDLRKSPLVLQRIEAIRNFRLNSDAAATRKMADYPTDFWYISQPNTDYILIPRHSSQRRRYVPIGFMSSDVIVNDSCSVIPNATLYEFGILTSNIHMAWMRIVCGRIKSDYRYSGNIVYNNFPWCNPTPEQKAKIEQTAQAILDARGKYPDCSLADLYDETTMPPELRKAHQANDFAVMDAYGFDKKITESECVAELMKMYRELTEKA